MSTATRTRLETASVGKLNRHCIAQARTRPWRLKPHAGFVAGPMMWRGQHATTPEAADSIQSEGFRIGRGERLGRRFGVGVYLSLGQASAGLWADAHEGDVQLECEAEIDRVLIYCVSGPCATRMNHYDGIVDAAVDHGTIPQPVQDLYDSGTIVDRDDRKRMWRAARVWGWEECGSGGKDMYSELLQAFGFDGLCILQQTPHIQIGGNQLCVFDAAKVRAI